MKILESSVCMKYFDTEEEKEIIDLIKKSNPNHN